MRGSRQGERGAAAACSRVPPCPVAPPVAAALLTAHGRTSAGGRARAKAPGSDSRRCPCHLVRLEWWRGAGVGIRPVTHTLRKRAPGLPIALPSRSLRSRSLQFCPAWGSSAPVSLRHCCLTRASTGRSVSQSWKFIASSGSWLRSGQPVEPGVCQPWPAAPLAGCLDHGQVAGAVQAPLQLQDSHPPLAAGEQCAHGQGRTGHPGAHFSPPRFSSCPTRPPGAALRAPCVLHAQAPRCFCFPVSCGPSPEVCRGHGGAGRGAETQEGGELRWAGSERALRRASAPLSLAASAQSPRVLVAKPGPEPRRALTACKAILLHGEFDLGRKPQPALRTEKGSPSLAQLRDSRFCTPVSGSRVVLWRQKRTLP